MLNIVYLVNKELELYMMVIVLFHVLMDSMNNQIHINVLNVMKVAQLVMVILMPNVILVPLHYI